MRAGGRGWTSPASAVSQQLRGWQRKMLTILKASLLPCCQHTLQLDMQALELCIPGPVASGGDNRGACWASGALSDSRAFERGQLSCVSLCPLCTSVYTCTYRRRWNQLAPCLASGAQLSRRAARVCLRARQAGDFSWAARGLVSSYSIFHCLLFAEPWFQTIALVRRAS